MTCAVYIMCVMQLNSNSANRQNFKSKIARHFCEIVIFIGTQEGFQAMTTSRSSKCPPAVPKRGPDTRLSSTSSSSESSVFSLQVTLQLIAHNSHSFSAVLQLWHYSWLRTTLTQFQPYYSCDITADCAQLTLSLSHTVKREWLIRYFAASLFCNLPWLLLRVFRRTVWFLLTSALGNATIIGIWLLFTHMTLSSWPSVCVYVCHNSQVGFLLKRLNWSSWFLAQRTYDLFCTVL